MPSTSLRKHTLIFKLGFHKRSVVCLRCEIEPGGWEGSFSPSDKVTPSPCNSNHPSDWKRRGVGSPSPKDLVEFPICCCGACAYNVLRAGLYIRNPFFGDRRWRVTKVTFLNDSLKGYLSPLCYFLLKFFPIRAKRHILFEKHAKVNLAFKVWFFAFSCPALVQFPIEMILRRLMETNTVLKETKMCFSKIGVNGLL